MRTCEPCDREFKSTQGLRGHQQLVHSGDRNGRTDESGEGTGRLDRILARLRGNGNKAELSPSPVTAEELLEPVELSGLLDGLVDRFSGPLRDQVRREVEDIATPVLADLADLNRRLEDLEARKGQLAQVAMFLKERILPTMENRLDGKEDVDHSKIVTIVPDSWERLVCGHYVPPGSRTCAHPAHYEPAQQCGHKAPPGSLTCDSLICVAAQITVAPRKGDTDEF